MHKLVNYFSDNGKMLPQPLSEIYENIRDYFVIREGEHLVAYVAQYLWSDLAEIKSLAVADSRQEQRIGTQLVAVCHDSSRQLSIPNHLLLNLQTRLFDKPGFSKLDKMELPQKVWSECYD
jgi:amino-acid N-acetyltransferase